MSEINSKHWGHLSFGIHEHLGEILLPELLTSFVMQNPNVSITITEGSSDYLEDRLDRGALDLCVMNLFAPRNTLAWEYLSRQSILLVCSANHPITYGYQTSVEKPAFMDLRNIQNERLLLHPSDYNLSRIVSNILSRLGIQMKNVLEIQDIQTLINLAEVGLGFTFIPTPYLIHSSNRQLAYFYFETPPTTWPLALVWRNNIHQTESIRSMMSIARSVISSSGTVKNSQKSL